MSVIFIYILEVFSKVGPVVCGDIFRLFVEVVSCGLWRVETLLPSVTFSIIMFDRHSRFLTSNNQVSLDLSVLYLKRTNYN